MYKRQDIDELAVESAKENLELNGISEDRAKVYLGNLVSVVNGKKFDVEMCIRDRERAVEVCLLTGDKFSVLSKKNIKNNNYNFLKVALERDREYLYERINLRVDIMLEKGLEQEVRALYEKYGENLRKINIIGLSLIHI